MHTLARTALAAAALTALAGPTLADQFIVAVSQPLGAISQPMLDTLKVTIVDGFDFEGRTFVVIDAPGEAYVETLFNVIPAQPLSLHQLPVDWAGAAMADMDPAARMRFGQPVACAFCS